MATQKKTSKVNAVSQRKEVNMMKTTSKISFVNNRLHCRDVGLAHLGRDKKIIQDLQILVDDYTSVGGPHGGNRRN